MENKKKNIIVVLNYNDWEETTRFCKAVEGFESVDNILIVDNKSTDGSAERLKSLNSGKVTLLLAENNKGYAAGNNVGLNYILDQGWNGNVVISNPDIYFTNDNLKNILYALNNPEIGVATGLITTNDVPTSNFAWMQPSFWELISNQFLLLYKIKRFLRCSMYLPYPKNDNWIYCNCVSGCFFCFTTDTLKQIGILDERTFLLGEENILGFRIRQAGKKTCVVTSERVEHKQHHSLKKAMKKAGISQEWLHESMLVYVKYYLRKRLIFQKLFSFLFWFACYEQRLVVKILTRLNRYNDYQ